MTAMTFPTTERLPRTGCDISTSYQQIIRTQESGIHERLDYFSPPLGFISRIGVTAPMCAGLGSGAMQGLTKEGLREALSRSRVNLVRYSTEIQNQANSHDDVEARTIAEQLRDIRKSFGLNASDLAALLGISRPTLYTWLDGQEPKPEAAVRILGLAKKADAFASLGLRRPDNLVKRPLFENGASLFGLLQQGKEIRSRCDVLRTLDEKEAANRGRIRGSDQSPRSFDAAAAESTPLYSE
ncbi:MAG: helix-turn-helix transcriptional regulator [Methylococcaceae bacterium]|nr:helix-turn-helix transcriptional regulator [Methylococcaceae bacterium]